MARTSEKREQILSAALRLIAGQGIHRLSGAELARLTGLSKQVVAYHFPDEEAILIALFHQAGRRGQELTEALVGGKHSPRERIFRIIDAAFLWAERHPDYARLFLLMYHWAAVSPALFAVHQTILKTGLERIRLCLLETLCYRDPVELDAVAHAIHNGLIGAVIRMVSLGELDSATAYRRHVYRATELLLTSAKEKRK